VEGHILRARQEIPRKIARAIVLTMLITSVASAPAFADVSPLFGGAAVGSRINENDSHIQLAQANLPSLGGVDDYMHQDGDGPSNAAVPPNGYSSGSVPPQNSYPQNSQGFYPQGPQNFYPQGAPSQEWDYGSADPNAGRNALIGAAVVGALAVGLWAYQQHEMHQTQIQQAQQPVRRRFNSQHRAHNREIE
jgi:hypothetical protein